MAEPLIFDARIIGILISVFTGLALVLKRLGFKLTKMERIPMPPPQTATPKSRNGRRELASIEAMAEIKNLWEKKRDVTYCDLIASGLKEDLEEIKKVQKRHDHILTAIAIKIKATID